METNFKTDKLVLEEEEKNLFELKENKNISDFENSLEAFDSHVPFENELIVDPDSDLKTIQDAINIAKERTVIKIKQGVYFENLLINKPYLEICAFEVEKPPILIGERKDQNSTPIDERISGESCIVIASLNKHETIKISNLYIICRGVVTKDSKTNNDLIYNNFNMIYNLEMNYLYDKNIIEGLVIDNRGRVSAISIYSGVVMIQNCNITMGYLSSYNKVVVHGIYCDNSIVFLNSVIIKGNYELMTVGCLAYQANIKIINSKFYQCKFAGFLSYTQSNNFVNLNKNIFNENYGCGVFLCGEGEIIIEENLIEKNQGVGLKLIDCNRISLVNNIIVENFLNGGEFINCDGLVMLNSFYNNKGCGCLLETSGGGVFKAKIYKNSIIENAKAGLVIKGEKNFAVVELNEQIGYNNFSGIHISDAASPTILNNVIFENMHQGILIVSGSSAYIKENEIRENIRANIALGGESSENTKIIDNIIIGSRNEGIFVIEGSGGVIEKNKIIENNDGIILMNSQNNFISENRIEGNIRCGILLVDSSPEVVNNQIYENQFIGLLLKKNSTGKFVDNHIKSRTCSVYFYRGSESKKEEIEKENLIDGRVDVQSVCTIF